MADESIVYEDEHIAVKYIKNPRSNFLFICFGDLINLLKAGKAFWGEGLAVKTGHSFLGFMAKRGNWYPQQSVLAAHRSVARLLPELPEHVVTYGGSMGGYAAIKYSKLFQATHVIAYVPQATIDPATIDDPRYRRYFDPRLNAGMLIRQPDVSGQITIISDPYYDLDEMHFAHIKQAHASVRRIPVAFTDHHATSILAGSGFFASVLGFTLNPSDDALHAVRRQANALKANKYVYFEKLLSERWKHRSGRVIRKLPLQFESDVDKLKLAALCEFRHGVHQFAGREIKDLRPARLQGMLDDGQLAVVSWNGRVLCHNLQSMRFKAVGIDEACHADAQWRPLTIQQESRAGLLTAGDGRALVFDHAAKAVRPESAPALLEPFLYYRYISGKIVITDGARVMTTEPDGTLSLRTRDIKKWEMFAPV